MKKKGFTLIELLAVIVILAIIALIAVPIILNIINDTKVSSDKRSMELYAKSVENAVADFLVNNPSSDLKLLSEEERVEKIKDYIKYDSDGSKIECDILIYDDNNIYLDNCNINGKDIEYTYGREPEKVCEVTKDETDANGVLGTFSNGDEVTCGSERFYIMPDHEDATEGTVSMLAKYNLNVGSNTYTGSTVGLQNENVVGYKSGKTTYGKLSFSNSSYWGSAANYTFIYNTNSSLYTYASDYQIVLSEIGMKNVIVTLPSYKQLTELGCSGVYCTSAPSWVYDTSYWTGSTAGGSYIWAVISTGNFGGGREYHYSNPASLFGMRPVVIVSSKQIKKI